VREDDACRIDSKCAADNLAWVDRRLSQRPPKQFFSHDEAVAGVQKQGCKHFEGPVAQPKLQKARNLRRIRQGIAPRKLVRQCSSGQFKCRSQQGNGGLSDPATGAELLIVGRE